uniref:Integrase catalytic domain-containing protein n=1 Tax=Ananas comosus var. bracteatus TaxID=296719 RepID=A0A6V7Q354_ANACO|nr:unnamed protein product [Ananas comosus var. bracteatus]
MLRACVLDFGGGWHRHLRLVEFTYNNSYQMSIQMAPLEALYKCRCRSPLHWSDMGERKTLGPEILIEAEEKVKSLFLRLLLFLILIMERELRARSFLTGCSARGVPSTVTAIASYTGKIPMYTVDLLAYPGERVIRSVTERERDRGIKIGEREKGMLKRRGFGGEKDGGIGRGKRERGR